LARIPGEGDFLSGNYDPARFELRYDLQYYPTYSTYSVGELDQV
jgi:hypothetical protein